MSDDIQKLFDEMAYKSAHSLAKQNPEALADFAAKTAIKADKLERSMVESMKEIGKAFDDVDEELAKIADECDYKTKLAVTAWVFKKIVEHAESPGSFRYLIYNRMGFDMDAYVPLYMAGGMTITNEFDLTEKKDD